MTNYDQPAKLELCDDEGCPHHGTAHYCRITVISHHTDGSLDDPYVGYKGFNPWRSMDSAPKDREIEVWAIDPVVPYHLKDGFPFKYGGPDNSELLPDLHAKTQWHEDAGFCVCELRVPILWREVE
jgi:hypothetical protein